MDSSNIKSAYKLSMILLISNLIFLFFVGLVTQFVWQLQIQSGNTNIDLQICLAIFAWPIACECVLFLPRVLFTNLHQFARKYNSKEENLTYVRTYTLNGPASNLSFYKTARLTAFIAPHYFACKIFWSVYTLKNKTSIFVFFFFAQIYIQSDTYFLKCFCIFSNYKMCCFPNEYTK